MGDTKVKINIHEGSIEIEGSQKFVEDHWDELKAYLEKQTSFSQKISTDKPSQNKPSQNKPSQNKPSQNKPKSSGEKQRTAKKSSSIPLISVDVKKTEKKPSLKELYDEKKPTTDMEIVTLFAFYLKTHLKINDIELGHASFCYTMINKKRPKSLLDTFRNAQRNRAWIERGSTPNSFTISTAGEDYINLDLPEKKP